MAKIPINHAIKSGSWLKCEIGDYSFRIRIFGFIKVKLKQIDDPQKIDPVYDLAAGDFWLLKLEVVNFCKKEFTGERVTQDNIFLIDNDDFEFPMCKDWHLRLSSDFAVKSGLKTFYAIHYLPKIKHSGAFIFFLPRDDSAEYSISVTGGEICEV